MWHDAIHTIGCYIADKWKYEHVVIWKDVWEVVLGEKWKMQNGKDKVLY